MKLRLFFTRTVSIRMWYFEGNESSETTLNGSNESNSTKNGSSSMQVYEKRDDEGSFESVATDSWYYQLLPIITIANDLSLRWRCNRLTITGFKSRRYNTILHWLRVRFRYRYDGLFSFIVFFSIFLLLLLTIYSAETNEWAFRFSESIETIFGLLGYNHG